MAYIFKNKKLRNVKGTRERDVWQIVPPSKILAEQ